MISSILRLYVTILSSDPPARSLATPNYLYAHPYIVSFHALLINDCNGF